ncbi:MAG: 50S ribosome-binding GTPase [Stigonema ocellatum SAG 48.90 = DSM 106950]|nr:50S ribosome-binding GTPase [Stigonema ocellatum SAG 48.90 = DSM 106950]
MSEQTLVAALELNYRFLMLTHIVCADQQIHNAEAKALQQLTHQTNIGQRTIEEMEKILAQDEHLLSVEDVARRVPPGQQSEVMRQMLAIAHVDGFFSPLEREMVGLVGGIWNWSKGEIERFIQQAEDFGAVKSSVDDDNNQRGLSVGARFVKGADSILSRGLVDNLAKIVPGNVGRQIEELRREILLAGPEYDDAIQQCAAIATEDYKFAEVALKGTRLALNNLGKGLQDQVAAIQSKTTRKGEAKTALEVAKQLETTRKALMVEILKEIESLSESLSAKQRALNHFSIAFMGKTKAGKSTLHAIITGEGWEAIGVGKQRTTRLNRVYEWKNIRIIDTPGIGAPGGKTDEEIAQSVIEESDVICYVVTNDSIQETEFNFLQLLKKKAKPLIILLNVKHNLRDSRRLEHFLKEPDKLFAIEGTSGLGGHIERIRRYAQQHYANDYFDIIPVMLLAAQLSREPEHKELKDNLFKASRMQNFLDSIRVSLVEHGPIRRSQTLLGSTVGVIDNPYKWVNQQAQLYQQLTDTLKTKRDTIRKDIQKAAKDNSASLLQYIEAIFQDALNAIPSFAEDHWDSNEMDLKLGWEQKLKAIHFDERWKNAYEETSKKFNKEVQEVLEEVGNELQLIAKLGGGNFTFTEQDSNNFRDFLRIGRNILGIAGAVITKFAPPIGIAIGIAATIVGLMTELFKSKAEKRREAVQKISNSLSSQLNNYHQTTRQQAKDDFGKYCDAVAMNMNTYFDELIQGLEAIIEQLETAKSKLDGTANYLNRAYAKRIIDWCLDKYEPLTDELIYKNIAKVKRDFGRSMTIETKLDLHLKKSQSVLNRVLQEDVSIKSIKSSK